MYRSANPFFCLIALFILGVSCTQTFTSEQELNTPIGIVAFRDPTDPTRGHPAADISEISNLKIFGYYTGNGKDFTWAKQSATARPDFMNDVRATQTASGVWSYEKGPVYWPVATDANISFFAYGPSATPQNGISLIQTTGLPRLRYEVPSKCADQPDLTIAVPLFDRNISNNGTAPVKFMLKHALTCIGFRIQGSGEKITGLSIQGIKTSGTLAMDGNALQWDLTDSSVATGGYPVILSKVPFEAPLQMSGLLNTTNGYLMMIPQQLGESARIVIDIEGQKSVSVSLNNVQWTAGKQIVYSIVLSAPGGGANLLYLNSEGKLAAAPWGGPSASADKPVHKDNILCVKFGGVIAFSLNDQPWSISQLRFYPLAGTASDYFQGYPFYSNAKWEKNIKNISDASYHQVANIRKGKGDICRLIGLSASDIINMTDQALNTYRSGWRLPSVADSKLFSGFESQTAYTAHWARPFEINGGYFPRGMEAARLLFLPAIGYRADNGDRYGPYMPNHFAETGQYWLNTINDNPGDASMFSFDATQVNPVAKFHAGKALPVRCVRDTN